jgi:hypothetical protein
MDGCFAISIDSEEKVGQLAFERANWEGRAT